MLERVRAIDPENPEMLVQEGAIRLFHDWDWTGAERLLNPDRALAPELLMPSFNLYGFLLAARGQAGAAMEAIQRGNDVEPLSAPRRTELAAAWLWLDDSGKATAEAERALELNPGFFLAHHHLGFAHVREGRWDEAAATFERGLAVAPQQSALRGGLALAHAGAGRRAEAVAILDALIASVPRANRAYAIARVHAALGRQDEALRWLYRSAEDRDPFMIWVRLDFVFEQLRADPRFDELVGAVGLPE